MTMRFAAVAVVAAILFAAGSPVQAQVPLHSVTGHSAYNATNHHPSHGHFAIPVVLDRPYFAGSYPIAGVIRAQGEKNVLDSMALINLQQARSMATDNHRKEVETWYALREANQARRAAERDERLARHEARQANHQPKPVPRLNPHEFEPATGELAWPAALADESMTESRQRIESLLDPQSTETHAAGQLLEEIQTLRQQLDRQVAHTRAMDWVAAKQFLDRLTGEIGFPTAPAALASR